MLQSGVSSLPVLPWQCCSSMEGERAPHGAHRMDPEHARSAYVRVLACMGSWDDHGQKCNSYLTHRPRGDGFVKMNVSDARGVFGLCQDFGDLQRRTHTSLEVRCFEETHTCNCAKSNSFCTLCLQDGARMAKAEHHACVTDRCTPRKLDVYKLGQAWFCPHKTLVTRGKLLGIIMIGAICCCLDCVPQLVFFLSVFLCILICWRFQDFLPVCPLFFIPEAWQDICFCLCICLCLSVWLVACLLLVACCLFSPYL